ncbi:TIM-barrel domain-containing protein [Arenimonas sp.]|jgi:oligosaccharide 4-alpha-D-glucosyltransferase|uniref:glycoside hydrolase family 31 protein n=1 Tax=Arenimonas sp. TaxID=1872635 RepID=UPI0037BEA2AB
MTAFRFHLGFALVFAISLPAAALEQTVQRVSRSDNSLTLSTDKGTVRVRFLNPESVEVFYQPTGLAQLDSFALIGGGFTGTTELKERAGSLDFGTTELKVRIDKAPLRIRFEKDGKTLLAENGGLEMTGTSRGFNFALQPQEKLMGTGQRVLGMDRRGHKLPLYNKASYGYTTKAEQMYYSLPAVVSSNKYLLLFDNTASGEVDLGKTDANTLSFSAVDGRTAYVVVAGDTYPEILENYTAVTGRQPLPPRWALGNFASRFGYRNDAEVRATAAKFKQTGFPVDALILDLYWFGPDIKGHMGNLAWDKKAFPDPEGLIADLKKDGINTILITEPFILTSSKRWQEAVNAGAITPGPDGQPKTFDFYFGNTGLVDVFNPKAQDWFWGIYRGLKKQGVAGWWGDLGEPEVHPGDARHLIGSGDAVHNAYGHQWAKMVYENALKDTPDERPFNMMRSGFAGSQRYGMMPWTGDVSREWGGLKPQVELSLQMSLLGLAYMHSDLGGFAGGEKFDAELYIRWLQYGVFQPVYRPHAQDHIASEPVFHEAAVQDVLRPYVNLRYRLLPYNYTLAYQNSMTGMPLMRPLFFSDETDLKLIDNAQTYFWGDAFLVTPVTEPGTTAVNVSLPKGIWFDYWNDARIAGGRTIAAPVSLNTIPVFVKAGAFIPMAAGDMRNTTQYDSGKLQLHYYADSSVKSASGVMYDDDGKNPNALRDKQFERLDFSAKQRGKSLGITLQRQGDFAGEPKTRQIELVVHNWPATPAEIRVDGIAHNGSRYDAASRTLHIPLRWSTPSLTLQIR